MKNRVENVSLVLFLSFAVFVFVKLLVFIFSFIVDSYESPVVSILM